MESRSNSLVPLFLMLLSLNILDISFTNPSHEANPFTLLMWTRIGLLPSACLKLGLVLLLGILCEVIRKAATSDDWNFAGKLLRVVLISLVAFYSFIVTWNFILLV